MNDVRRAIRLTEVGGILLLEFVLWLAYRRQWLRWRAQGVFARWEREHTHRRRRPARTPPIERKDVVAHSRGVMTAHHTAVMATLAMLRATQGYGAQRIREGQGHG